MPWRTRWFRAATIGHALFLLTALVGTAPARAQVDPTTLAPGDQLYEVRLLDGSSFVGRVSSVAGTTVVFTTSGGTRIEVARAQIAQVRPAEGRVVDGEYWPDDPGGSRLFFSSTGRSLEQGEGYLGTYLIVLPFVAVGVTDRITIGGGAPILLGELQPFYLAPKVQLLRTESAAVSVGVLHFVLSDDFDDDDVGVAYGVGTFGSRDDAVSVGLGFGYVGGDFDGQPVAMIGGEKRVGRRIKFLTENYFLPGESGLVFGGGFRFMGERVTGDIGVGGATGDGDVGCCVPLVNVSYTFGGRR